MIQITDEDVRAALYNMRQAAFVSNIDPEAMYIRGIDRKDYEIIETVLRERLDHSEKGKLELRQATGNLDSMLTARDEGKEKMQQQNLFPTRSEIIDNEREVFQHSLKQNGQAVCACCGRHALVSKLKIHSTLAYMLCRLYRASMAHHGHPEEWMHLEQFKDSALSGNDFSIVKHWGVAEPMPADYMEDKRSSGYWRLTMEGTAFIEEQAQIHRNVFVFNDTVIAVSPDHIGIKDALNNKFSYFDSTGIPQ